MTVTNRIFFPIESRRLPEERFGERAGRRFFNRSNLRSFFRRLQAQPSQG